MEAALAAPAADAAAELAADDSDFAWLAYERTVEAAVLAALAAL